MVHIMLCDIYNYYINEKLVMAYYGYDPSMASGEVLSLTEHYVVLVVNIQMFIWLQFT